MVHMIWFNILAWLWPPENLGDLKSHQNFSQKYWDKLSDNLTYDSNERLSIPKTYFRSRLLLKKLFKVQQGRQQSTQQGTLHSSLNIGKY